MANWSFVKSVNAQKELTIVFFTRIHLKFLNQRSHKQRIFFGDRLEYTISLLALGAE